MPGKLILLRHGQSQWNLENRFTGWTDVDLTQKGCQEAERAGRLISKCSFGIDIIFTSLLKRAAKTSQICLNQLKNQKIEVLKDWRLNERHYGSLQGLNKSETAKKYGDEQVLNGGGVMIWLHPRSTRETQGILQETLLRQCCKRSSSKL